MQERSRCAGTVLETSCRVGEDAGVSRPDELLEVGSWVKPGGVAGDLVHGESGEQERLIITSDQSCRAGHLIRRGLWQANSQPFIGVRLDGFGFAVDVDNVAWLRARRMSGLVAAGTARAVQMSVRKPAMSEPLRWSIASNVTPWGRRLSSPTS